MSVDETESLIEDGSLFDRLRELHPNFDVSLYESDELRAILNMFGSMSGSERKLGIGQNGLALCLAYCIEVMQSPEAYANNEDFDG
jgi:hypothetical protein